jgi:hypothetical protein
MSLEDAKVRGWEGGKPVGSLTLVRIVRSLRLFDHANVGRIGGDEAGKLNPGKFSIPFRLGPEL